MFGKSKVSQSMIDAVNSVLDVKVEQKDTTQPSDSLRAPMAPAQSNQTVNLSEASEKVPTPTGTKVYGSSYGNSKKARQDQTKSSVDTLKGPKDKEMKEAAKPDFLDIDKDGNKKEPMKKAITDKNMKEELKGNQHRIDANNNNKIDAQDFKILKAKKKVKEDMSFGNKLLEMVRKSDIPAYLRKAKGDTPLTVADVKAPKKDTISDPKNLAKARNEEVEKESCEDEVKKHEKRLHGKDGEVSKHVSKMHKEELEQIDETPGAQAMKSSGIKQSPDKLLARTGMNLPHKFPRKGQTDLGNIPGMNTPGVSKDTADYAEKRRGDRAKNLKPAIKAALGTHGPKGKLPEEVELDEGVMTHITLGKKVKNDEGGHDQTVHHKGEHIGNIHSYAHVDYETGKKTGRTKYATSDKHGDTMTVGHITPDEGIDELRWVHAHDKKDKKTQNEEVELTEEQLDEMINEVLGKDATAGDYISDFVHSDNPKFAGKSKAERKKMALGAYYGAQKESHDVMSNDPITTDTLAGRMPGGKANSFKSYKLRVRPVEKEGVQMNKAPEVKQPVKTPAMKSHEVHEATIAGLSGWKKMEKDVKDKSGAVHTPMSRAKDLARAAFKDIQSKTKVK